MPITLTRAGREYVLTLSNKGLTVDVEGEEVFRHWLGDIVPQAGTMVADQSDLLNKLRTEPPGTTFILPKGDYTVTTDPADSFKFAPIVGEAMTITPI